MTAADARDLGPTLAPHVTDAAEAPSTLDEKSADPAQKTRATPRNLSPVLAVIPPSCYVNPTWKGLAYAARDTAVYLAIIVGIALVDAWYLLLPLWILSAFIISGMFILAHDAAHGALFKSKKLNKQFARVMMLPSLHVYEGWVFGHNRLHHGHTARQGADFVWHPLTMRDWAGLSTWQRFLVRLEWSWIGAGLYYTRNIWLKMVRWKQPDSQAKAIHKDQLFMWAFFVVASALAIYAGLAMYGTALGAGWMWFKVLVVPAALFMETMGLVVYMHHIEPDIRWHPRGQWDKFKGQMEATTNLRLPPGFDFFFHNITIHVPHHVDMRIPFYHLPEAAKAIRDAYPDVVREGRLSLIDYVRHTRACKIYDFENGHWNPYPSK